MGRVMDPSQVLPEYLIWCSMKLLGILGRTSETGGPPNFHRAFDPSGRGRGLAFVCDRPGRKSPYRLQELQQNRCSWCSSDSWTHGLYQIILFCTQVFHLPASFGGCHQFVWTMAAMVFPLGDHLCLYILIPYYIP